MLLEEGNKSSPLAPFGLHDLPELLNMATRGIFGERSLIRH